MTAISFGSPEPDLNPPLPFAPDTPPQEIWGTLYNKFYDWKYHECLSVLDSLRVYPADQDNEDNNDVYNSRPDLWTTRTDNRSRGIDTEYFEIITFGDEEEDEEKSILVEVIVEDGPSDRRVNRSWAPNPRYTTCTPLGSNVAHPPRDTDDTLTAEFSRYSDDPTFNLRKYLALHHRFAWQSDQWDPDHEMIKLETVRLLHFQQGISLRGIDDYKFPTFPKVRFDPADGMIWQASQRDVLCWPESQMSPWPQLTLGYIVSHYSELCQDTFSQVQYGSTIFCPNLHCLASTSRTCRMHGVPSIREQTPTIVTTEYADGDFCGDRCFLHLKDALLDEEELDALIWPDGTHELETLQAVLKLAPDSEPCALAVICRLPCDQVFANRRQLYPDQDILDDRAVDPGTDRIPVKYCDEPVEVELPAEDPESEMGTPYLFPRMPPPPCSHSGACRKNVCSCFDEGYHCERNCRCSRNCPNRWQGCKCKHSKHGSKRSSRGGQCMFFAPHDEDGKSGCPCANVWRECDPEVCRGCKGRRGRNCLNQALQLRRFPQLEISRSQWGYGAYAHQSIPRHTWLGDYLGDIENGIASDSLVAVTEMIHKHTGLNYTFELASGGAGIDSMVAGNETRYLNHSDSKRNCEAQVILVHNTLRVALYTTSKIAPGQELLLNYGNAYWSKDGGQPKA